MLAVFFYRILADSLLPWAMKLASGVLARSLDMPEPLLHSSSEFVIARVLAFEHGLGRSFCPFRLAAILRAWWRALR